MDPIPRTPHQTLAARLHDLIEVLPTHYGPLLAAPEFARGRAAVEALQTPGRIEAVVAVLEEDEAAWIADVLAEKWALIAPANDVPASDPALQLSLPAWALHLGGTVAIGLRIAVTGLAPGWTVIWPEGATEIDPGTAAEWRGEAGDRPGIELTVRVIGHPEHGIDSDGDTAKKRAILVASGRVALARAQLTLSPDRRLLSIHDADPRLLAGLCIDLGSQRVTLDAEGMARLDTPLSEGATPVICGVAASDTDGGG